MKQQRNRIPRPHADRENQRYHRFGRQLEADETFEPRREDLDEDEFRGLGYKDEAMEDDDFQAEAE